MPAGIYVTPSKFVSFAEMKGRQALQQEVASRDAAWDFSSLIGLLPDPDPVLTKRGDGVEILESLTADAHLCAVIQTRKLGVKTKEFKFEPGTDADGKTSSQSEQLCRDFSRDIHGLEMRQLITSILDAPLYGMTPLELQFAPGTHLHLKKIEAKPVRWFGFTEENEPRFISADNPWNGEALPWGKFVFARHEATYDNPYGLRLLSRCFWPVTFKKGGLKFWVSFMEKYGTPFLLGHYGQNADESQQARMLASLQQMIRTAVAVVPQDARVEMLNKSGAGAGHTVFDKMKSAMDAEISKVILGQTLTTEAGERGSYGLGKVHGDVLSAFQDADKMLVRETLNNIARIYGQINADSVPPPVCTFYEEEDPCREFADRDRVLEKGGRVKLTRSYYLRRYGFQDDDIEMVEPVQEQEQPDERKKAQKKPLEYEAVDVLRASSQLKLVEAKQQELDEYADEVIREGGDIFGGFKKDIRSWLYRCSSLQQALLELPDLFTRLNIDELQGALFSSLLAADGLGQASVPQAEEYAETLWGKGKPFREALDFFKAKSFTIAGHSQADLVAAVKDALTRAMEEGGDIASFRANVDALFMRHGLDPLSNHRIDTIYRTNMQTAFQAGRFTQLTRPHILKARPYWRYVAVRDGATRPAHRKMHDKIFHHANPIWRTWYPPNGFNCRCQVVALSRREIQRDGLEVIDEDLTGSSFEVVDEETGAIQLFRLTPDKNWGAASGTLERLLDQQRETSGGAQAWKEVKAQPGPLDFGRPAKGAIGADEWLDLERGPALQQIMKNKKISESEALAEIEARYRKEMGISPLESRSVIRSKDGEAVTITLQALAHAMVTRRDARERCIPYLRHTLEDPFEILLTEYATPTGKTRYRKKYIGLYKGEKEAGVIIVAEIQKDGSVLWNIMNTKKKNLDRQRRGVKLLYGR